MPPKSPQNQKKRNENSNQTSIAHQEAAIVRTFLFDHTTTDIKINQLKAKLFKKQELYQKQVHDAILQNKIFLIQGNCYALQKILEKRGWIEKLFTTKNQLESLDRYSLLANAKPNNKYEKALLSKMLRGAKPNLSWKYHSVTRPTSSPSTPSTTKKIELLSNIEIRADINFTYKQGLLRCWEQSHWWYIPDICEMNIPRCYSLTNDSEIDLFTRDYLRTICTSLLFFITNHEDPITLFSLDGIIGTNVICLAVNYIRENITNEQNILNSTENLGGSCKIYWKKFIDEFQKITKFENKFKVSQYDISQQKLANFISIASKALKAAEQYWPDISSDGYENLWILKPNNGSCGCGIEIMKNYDDILEFTENNADKQFIIQKYIERPLLIFDTKFDIRQYFLLTNVNKSINIWMYKDCYVKFSSRKFTLKNFTKSIHLTNFAIQRKYLNFKPNATVSQSRNNVYNEPSLPPYRMWNLRKFKEYLKSVNHENEWDTNIYPTMKKNIIATVLCASDEIDFSATHNCFQLYGCDFILTENYQVKLLEVNKRPDLTHTTPVTKVICTNVIDDMIKVLVDYGNDPSASTGEFECIYNFPTELPKLVGQSDLTVIGKRYSVKKFEKTINVLQERVNNVFKDNENVFKNIENVLKNTENVARKIEENILSENIANKSKNNIENVFKGIEKQSSKIIVQKSNIQLKNTNTNNNQKKCIKNNKTEEKNNSNQKNNPQGCKKIQTTISPKSSERNNMKKERKISVFKKNFLDALSKIYEQRRKDPQIYETPIQSPRLKQNPPQSPRLCENTLRSTFVKTKLKVTPTDKNKRNFN